MKRMLRDCGGGSLVEYALIAALISIVAIVALQTLGSGASNLMNSAATSI